MKEFSLGPNEAKVWVYTEREGVLAGFGHDLKLIVEAFELRVALDPPGVTAMINAGSLRVVAARENGFDKPELLSTKDRARIHKYLNNDVLLPDAHPFIRFRSEDVTPLPSGFRVVGELELRGVTAEISFSTHVQGDAMVAEHTINQTTYGIQPFRAMMGALKLRDPVRIRVEIPWPVPGLDT